MSDIESQIREIGGMSDIDSHTRNFIANTSQEEIFVKIVQDMKKIDNTISKILMSRNIKYISWLILILGNEEKDRGKSFEKSYTRVIAIMLLTYVTLFGYMSLIGVKDAYLNAVIPTVGFNLSTLSMSSVQYIWEYLHKKLLIDEDENLENKNTNNNNYSTFDNTIYTIDWV